MPTPTPEELTTAINSVNDALAKLRSVQKDLTYNPKVDKLIGKSYQKLSQASGILQQEYNNLP